MYKVIWLISAKKELQRIWFSTSDQNAVKRAAFELTRRLEKNGPNVGESRANHIRVALEKPLGIHFFVSEKDKKVFVGRIWQYK